VTYGQRAYYLLFLKNYTIVNKVMITAHSSLGFEEEEEVVEEERGGLGSTVVTKAKAPTTKMRL